MSPATRRISSSRFLLSHPEIKVDIFQYPYGALTEKLKSGELDVILANVLCEKAFAKEEILSRPMFESFNYLVADRSIAEKYPPGDAAAMLRGECLITNCEDTGPNSMEMLRQMLLREFGVVPERFAQTNSTNAQMLMVRACHALPLSPILSQRPGRQPGPHQMNMGEMIRYDHGAAGLQQPAPPPRRSWNLRNLDAIASFHHRMFPNSVLRF